LETPLPSRFVVDESSSSSDSWVGGLTPHPLKWWPGGLGKTATHCVLHAKLLLPSGVSGVSSGAPLLEDKGVHAFFVPLRDVATHRPLNGVSLGDIGPKLGFNSIDNGLAFTLTLTPTSTSTPSTTDLLSPLP
jgi:acyl-CoA oxidase